LEADMTFLSTKVGLNRDPRLSYHTGLDRPAAAEHDSSKLGL
jgi:hypothetical protein